MKRFQNTLRHTFVALLIVAGAFAQTGCTSVRERRVDVATGQVENVNRRQFFVKSLLGGRRERVKYVQSSPESVANNFPPQQFAPQRFAPQYPVQPTANIATNGNGPQTRMFGVR